MEQINSYENQKIETDERFTTAKTCHISLGIDIFWPFLRPEIARQDIKREYINLPLSTTRAAFQKSLFAKKKSTVCRLRMSMVQL